ncbi:MAG: trypsin-like peptidase domain-containing protein [Tepidisphaeraceae bacterium]|jgi:S1-C subfamily serine protease
MSQRSLKIGWLGLLTLLLSASVAPAAKLILTDGTVLEGTVIPQGDQYWIKTSDGQSRFIPADQVTTYTPDAEASGSSDSSAPTGPLGTTPEFTAAHNRAEESDSCVAALAVWQQFIDQNPDSPDLALAQSEVKRWQDLIGQHAEKVNGKWIGGDQLKEMVQQSNDLIDQSWDMWNAHQTIQSIEKLRAALKIYPNSFIANFLMGFIAMDEKKYDDAQDFYSEAVRLRPHSIEALNNLGIVLFFQSYYEESLDTFQKAVEIQDSQVIVQNMINALQDAPGNIKDLPRFRDAIDASNLLAAKYNISGPSRDFTFMPPPMEDKAPPSQEASPDWAWEGTGFFLTPDGLILTNRHVVKGSKTLLVAMGDQQWAGEVVAMDDAQDLALVRVKTRSSVAYVHLSPTDTPPEGADCVVLGFPLLDRLGSDLKVTRGIVSSSSQNDINGADVLTDAKVNPGNSGGPIVDQFGNVMAIVSMKTISESDKEDTYGIGISSGHIREFLAKQHVSVEPAATGPSPQILTTEQIVAQIKPATVCIQATN